MGQEASVSMRCPPHHTHPASITTKLRRFLRKRRRFSKFSPTFFGKSPTFFFFSPTLFEIARTFLSPTALALLPFSLIQLFSFLFARWEGSHVRACTRPGDQSWKKRYLRGLSRARACTRTQQFCTFCFHNLHKFYRNNLSHNLLQGY